MIRKIEKKTKTGNRIKIIYINKFNQIANKRNSMFFVCICVPILLFQYRVPIQKEKKIQIAHATGQLLLMSITKLVK